MAGNETTVDLPEDLVLLLDREAKRRGISRSVLILDLLEQSIHDLREAEIDQRIIDGYIRRPPASPDQWRDATSELFARLDAEERAAGFDPW